VSGSLAGPGMKIARPERFGRWRTVSELAGFESAFPASVDGFNGKAGRTGERATLAGRAVGGDLAALGALAAEPPTPRGSAAA
jgi:hypothetical protein